MYNSAYEFGDIMTVQEFIEACKFGCFVDDGDGHPVKYIDGKPFEDRKMIISEKNLQDIPSDATHINWYNK